MTDQLGDGDDRSVPCPDCEHGRLTVTDEIHVSCDNCDAVVFRTEAGI